MPGKVVTTATIIAATAAGALGGRVEAQQLWEQPFQDPVKQVACISQLGRMATHPTYFAPECGPFAGAFSYRASEVTVYAPGKFALVNGANGNQAGTTEVQQHRVTYSPMSPTKFATTVHLNSSEYSSSHASDTEAGTVVGGLLGLLVSGAILKFGPSIRRKRAQPSVATSPHEIV